MTEAALAKKDPMGSALAAFNPENYNVCAPMVALDKVPDMHRISVRVVQVDPETDTYLIPGEKKEDPDAKVGIGKVALDKLAAAANIQWVPGQCGRIDDGKDPYFVTYRAVGIMRNFDGETRVLSAEKTIDLRGKPGMEDDAQGNDTQEIIRVAKKANENEIEYSKKYKRDPKPPRDPWQQITQMRQNIHSLAESKAKNRAIRAALAVPVAMPKSKVKKPFVIPALVLQPDLSDPDVKRAAIAHMFGASAALYGAPQGPRPVEAYDIQPIPEKVDPETGEIHEPEVVGASPEPASSSAEPWEEPPKEEERKPLGLPMDKEALAALPSDRRAWFVRLNEIVQAVYDKFGAEIGYDHIKAAMPAEFAPATIPATEIAKIAASLKAVLGV